MAHYRFCMKNGKALGAVANFSYNMGLEKYSYKEDEIVESFHNIPEWAKSPYDFWEKYSQEDRANSSYKKLENHKVKIIKNDNLIDLSLLDEEEKKILKSIYNLLLQKK